jgi:gamma-glutamyl-gamma-aminobutyrate hydrolase PuuD
MSRWEDVTDRRFGNFLAAIEGAGAEGVELRDPASDLRGMDGLLLTDGIDVAPEGYGAAPHPKTKHFDAVRDAFETRLLHEALERGLPVLAVCRGHQMLNVALGGGLLQHIDDNSHRAHYEREGHPSEWHTVRVERGSRLSGLVATEELLVNSRHHQAVTPETLAPRLRAVAVAPDGVIEAVESAEHPWVLGVQWHPERPEPDEPSFEAPSMRLFAGLVEQARKVTVRA